MSVNGLNKITERILTEAQADADRILAQAEAECEAIRADYAARADEIRERLSTAAEQKGADMISRAKSAAAMEKRNILLQQRSDLIEGVFTGARDWVLALPQEKYAELLAGLAAAALYEMVNTELENKALYGDEEETLPNTCELIFNKKDRETCAATVLKGVRSKLIGKIPQDRIEGLTVSDQVRPIEGGVILRCTEVEVNCSFELLFAQLRRNLEAEVNTALFEERGRKA